MRGRGPGGRQTVWRALAVLALGLAAHPVAAADDAGDPAAGVLELAGPVGGTLYSGRGTVITVPLRLKPGWHAQANPSSTGMIATELLQIKCGPVKFGARRYPAGRPFRLAGSDETLSVYEGDFAIRFAVVAPPTVVQDAWHHLELTLRYQPCDATTCYPAREMLVRGKVRVLPAPGKRASARR